MLCQDTDKRMEAIHIPSETILLAQKMQRIVGVITDENKDGNGEIIFKLKVAGGKISRVLDFAGKWFPGNKKK